MIPAGATAVVLDAALPTNTIGIYVGVAGNVNASINGSDVLFKGAAAGSVIPGRFTKVKTASTTATDMVAMCE